MNDITIEAFALYKSYQLDGTDIEVLKGVDLTVHRGEKVAIIGPSGTGKSTLLHQLGLLELPTVGQVLFKGIETTTLIEKKRAQLRLSEIGFVFQFHHLLPEFDAVENVMLPGLIIGMSRDKCIEKAQSLLSQVQLQNRFKHKPGELSGGEQQRVALARALMNNPTLILADEPTGNLDKNASSMLRDLLWDICRDRGTSLVIVTHNETLVSEADLILQMNDGVFV
ncbi:MAG: ABC transporter ATP-binding protein [Calditrichaeota bacterium]|jgi:lipoprotein-releasing system ATP-binding protein|nr:ABC transporter ATP-binding protein [Calditrichota bacterium]MBT7617730.1 ABC transporter ATP-binding protein [Calditrichota bacterium]MBT7787701.1 ABC transporter ATP-binding protein [Calditrichota bacterium]